MARTVVKALPMFFLAFITSCGMSKSIKKEPIAALTTTAVKTADASLEIRAATQEVMILVADIKQLQKQKGDDWEITGPHLESLFRQVNSLYRRLARLSSGGAPAALAAVANAPQAWAAISALASLFEKQPSSVKAGDLVAVLEKAPPPKVEKKLPPKPSLAESRTVVYDAPAEKLKAHLLELFFPESERRAQAAWELAGLGDFRVLEVLKELTSDEDPVVRLYAIYALGRINEWSVALKLRQIASDPSREIAERQAALEALAAHGSDWAADLLFDLIPSLEDVFRQQTQTLLEERFPKRLAHLKALFQAESGALAEGPRDAELAELLARLADTRLPRMRLEAAQALARLGDERAVAALHTAAFGRDARLAQAAIETLGTFSSPAASWTLYELVKNERLELSRRREAAKSLLRQDSLWVASLLLELERARPGTLEKLGISGQATELHKKLLPQRMAAFQEDLSESNVQVEVELLRELLLAKDFESRRRTILRALSLRADILPALQGYLSDSQFAEIILTGMEEYPIEKSRPLLEKCLLDSKQPQSLRTLALDSLIQKRAFTDAADAHQILVRLEDEKLAASFSLMLSRHQPELAKQLGVFQEVKPPPDRSGVVPLAIGLGLHGAAGMAMVSAAGNPQIEGLIFLPIMGGSILGVGSSLLLTWKQEEFTLPQAIWVNTTGLWTLYELGLAALSLSTGEGDETLERVGLGLAFLAQIGGIAFGWSTRDTLGKTWGQQLYMDASLMMGSLAGVGAGLLESSLDENHTAAFALGGSLAGLVLSGTLGRSLEFRGADAFQTINTMALGGWLGANIANISLSPPSDYQVWGASLLGTAAGFGLGSVLAAYTQPRASDILALDGALVAGTMLGLGAALQRQNPSGREYSLWMLGGEALALGAGALAAPHLDIDATGGWFSASASVMGGVSGYLLVGALQPDSDTAAWGGLLIGVPVGLGAGLAMSSISHPSPTRAALTDLSFLAGSLAGMGSVLQYESPGESDYYYWLLGGGLGGATLGWLLPSNELKLSGPDDLQIATSTFLGGWTGLWTVQALRGDKLEYSAGGALIGSALGFGAGAVAAAYTDPSYGQVGRVAAGYGLGSLFALSLGMTVESLDWSYVYGLMLGGGAVGLASALALEGVGEFSSRDWLLVGFGSLWGLYQGMGSRAAAGVRGSWSDRVSWGSALLGLSGGALVAGALGYITEIPPEVVGRAATGGLFGSMIGGGLGMMIPQLEEKGPWALALSAGWAGLGVYAFSLPSAEYTAGDWLALALGGGWGVWQGYLIGSAAGFSGNQLSGAMLLGLGLGFVGGDIFARADNLAVGEVLFTEISSYAGSGLGAGAAMLVEGAGATAVGISSALGGWALKTATGFFADKLKFRPDDIFEYLFMQGFGSWQGAGFALLGDVDDRETQAGALIGLSSGFLLPLVTNQMQDFSLLDDLFIAGAAAMGSWTGALSVYTFTNSTDAILLGTLLGGDVGLLACGLILSDAVGASRWRVGWTELTALGGLGLGVSLTATFSRSLSVLSAGMAVGTAAGLLAGVLWTGLVPEPARKPSRPVESTPDSENTFLEKSSSFWERVVRWVMPAVVLLEPPQSRPHTPPPMLFGLQGIVDL